MNGDAFNEGVGHGGIVVNMVGGSAQQNVIIDPWTIDRDTMVILQPDQFGTTAKVAGTSYGKKAGRIKNITATGTAQLPTTNGGTTAVPLVEGQKFQDPQTGDFFWISKVNEAYQSGQFWKQEITCEQEVN